MALVGAGGVGGGFGRTESGLPPTGCFIPSIKSG